MMNGYRQGRVDLEQFWVLYLEQLARLDPRKVLEDLGSPVVLFCCEKDPAECHRSRAAEWIERTSGIAVPEYAVTSTTPKPDPGRQGSLFPQ